MNGVGSIGVVAGGRLRSPERRESEFARAGELPVSETDADGRGGEDRNDCAGGAGAAAAAAAVGWKDWLTVAAWREVCMGWDQGKGAAGA